MGLVYSPAFVYAIKNISKNQPNAGVCTIDGSYWLHNHSYIGWEWLRSVLFA